MTSIPEHAEQMNSIYQKLKQHFCETYEQTSVINIKLEFDVGVPSSNLTQRSGT